MILIGTELMTMVRDERWKLVEFVDSDQGQLFDLRADPDELHNLRPDKENAEAQWVKVLLREDIARWQARSSLHTADMRAAHR